MSIADWLRSRLRPDRGEDARHEQASEEGETQAEDWNEDEELAAGDDDDPTVYPLW